MKLYFHKTPQGNFGDDLNGWLWEEALDYTFDDDDSQLLVGVGTIFDHRIPEKGKKIIMGSGYGYGRMPRIDENFDIRFVRGPKSAEALGLDQDKAITDPANLTTKFIPKQEKKYKYSYVPHVGGAINGDWDTICDMLGIHYIDPRGDSKEVIREISSTEFLITEAMHGAIIADAYRVPWVATVVYDFILGFKWQDFCASLDVAYEPVRLTPLWNAERTFNPTQKIKASLKRGLGKLGISLQSWSPPAPPRSKQIIYDQICVQLNEIINNGHYLLSEDSVCENRLVRIEEKIQELKDELHTAN